jgi:hypothetical protein
MAIVFAIDAATAYALWIILAPYWWYAALWLVFGAGGLIFSEWLWERVGNNEKQIAISSASKKVSAAAVMLMALFTSVELVTNIITAEWVGGFAVFVVISLAGFHAWQSYQYHEVDDDYIALTLEAKAEASNQKELRSIHRAGRRIEAKKKVYVTGAMYQGKHGDAFGKLTGKNFQKPTQQFAKDVQKPPQIEQPSPTPGGKPNK